MTLFREPGILERQRSAAAAKKALLEKFNQTQDYDIVDGIVAG